MPIIRLTKSITKNSTMTITKESLSQVTAIRLKEYGEYVVMQRAVPDFRDGLKPVHRSIIWSMHKLGVHSNSPFKKSARTVGDVIGKFHPHGDAPVYGAMVGITGTRDRSSNKGWVSRNVANPLIEGYGNFGDQLDNAAAYRYTEARLSKLSDLYLLDSTYLAVSDFIPNFSGDDVIPLVLPAKLPILMLNGSYSIAVGISAGCPPFEPKGVLALVRQAIAGQPVTTKDCIAKLRFNFPYGGECVATKEELRELFSTGKGSIPFVPTIKVEPKKITLTSLCPGLASVNSLLTFSERISKIDGVGGVHDLSDKEGFKLEIVPARGTSPERFAALVDEVTKCAVRKDSYDLGITIRGVDKTTFEKISFPEFFKRWTAWRIELEVKAIKYLIQQLEVKLARLNLMLKAVINCKVVFDSLQVEDSEGYLVKKLKITREEADTILSLMVKQLKKMDARKLEASIKEVNAEIVQLKKELKAPHNRVLASLPTDLANC